ncbi:MOSC domain-containing protein [Streptacidiphilus neutrinimicus]|uniref:MOSC domain-containing protein n=1 Tax=Streptacidiphilus neutrinimicus TaxID=105420 RepID=UPI000A868ADB|nr:MOSC N-terminal beta barrel domain-containing protein [Streptacidiphilus neutrinimicus]
MTSASPDSATALCTVAALWRYPVKSMLGEALDEAAVTERGLDGDRRLAVLDLATGKVASAKQPRLWRGLLSFRATLAEGPAVRIRRHDDASAWDAGDPAADALLSAALRRSVTLIDTPPVGACLDRARPEQVLRDGEAAEVDADVVAFGSAAPPGTFFDFAPLHLVTTATLARIGALSARGRVEAERFRPNLVLDTGEGPFAEHAWAGREWRVGPELVLRVVASTPRCAVPTLAHGPLPRDPDTLRVPSVHHRVPALPGRPAEPCVGVYAQVLRPGRVRLGDSFTRQLNI